jgi:hypothetical protein
MIKSKGSPTPPISGGETDGFWLGRFHADTFPDRHLAESNQ